jgi:hypothetical protein
MRGLLLNLNHHSELPKYIVYAPVKLINGVFLKPDIFQVDVVYIVYRKCQKN